MKYISKIDGQFSVESLLQWLVTTDDRFNRTGPGIRLGARIEDAVTAAKDAACIELQPDHYAELAAAAEGPSAGFPPLYVTRPDAPPEKLPGAARAWLPALDAIRDAKDEPPKKAEPEPVAPAPEALPS